jgi:hypothetical protein
MCNKIKSFSELKLIYGEYTEMFAKACYDQNSTDDLVEVILERGADKADCESWGITPTQYREAIATGIK